MGNPTTYKRVTNCLNTLVVSKVTCNCYFINSCNDDIVKYSRFEHLKVIHYTVHENTSKNIFIVKITFEGGNSIHIDVPIQSETFSYGTWEFGFQWKEGNDRRSVSFALDTESANWNDYNKK
ncbi:hypothetical protein [Treponema sp.]|uniref:hypothetical protein n=1 Tax=Treponema sp. TaxID=166 RepID=UPI002579C427|nr:hypothetical protein [Treponema sp.]MBE6354746.1 hypothetical protein [Treponema sp.]